MNDRTASSDTLLPAALAGLGALFASLVAGAVLSGARATIGLENVTVVYMTVVAVAALAGGTSGGLMAAVGASLSYNFFFTTPYRTLRIDSFEQVVTVALLFVAGALVSFAANATRGRLTDDWLAPEVADDDLTELVHAIARAREHGVDATPVAVQGLHRLLHGQWVALIPFDDVRGHTVVWAGEPPVVDELAPAGWVSWEGVRRRRAPGLGVTAHVFVDGRYPAVLVVMPRAGRQVPRYGAQPAVLAVVRALEADAVRSSRDPSGRT